MNDVREFTIDIPPATLTDLRERLARTRFSPRVGDGWEAGTDPDYLAAFVASWADFDWGPTERAVNQIPQQLVRAGGADIHVLHVPARGDAVSPIPLVLTHGWPSSFFEFLPLIGPLTDPAGHGGDATDAFDVIIPSLPGFGFSEQLPQGPTEPSRIADLWVEVMEQLGYRSFGAYGGDIGSHVTNFLGANHPQRVLGVFTHHPNLHPQLDPAWPLSSAEQRYLEERSNDPGGHDDGYAAIQATRPNSLAAGLADSPAGLAAWLVEKYREWSDCEGDLESSIDRGTLMSIATLYWVTNTIGTSFLPYRDDDATPPLPPVTAPAGLILTPEDAHFPREFAARTYTDIQLWRGPEPGGHFLALEQPERLVRDLRDFFRPLRTASADRP
ncbi:epoxide hydrolase family protein [Aeromicrobium choanae]|uniref:Pimeloyl-ACP methyl ester carboxylesterase n=1 Tax=Aeromicrobium choanae TaxID=1736691 RepID=A0A1T4Z8V7_9ACTN|nr:epoxide hydrolase family protein [Aeromicrobium choanae]SKB10414.1 Pimeloyl-ACP methyl ester carboxylesterase [Aeromicrobium choanae]